jgi:hypothetical protein
MKSVVKLAMFVKKLTDWVAKPPAVINGYNPKDTANGDETELFFYALPNKTLCLEAERCSDVLTVFLCIVMTGKI